MLKRLDCEKQAIGCLRHLASVCDGANELDGVGFSGADASFGRSLASSDRLSDNQLGAAVRLLQKYRATQLGGFELPTEEDVRRVLLTEDSVAPRINPVDAMTKISKPKLVKRGAVAIEKVESLAIVPSKPWLASEWRTGLNEQQQEAFDAAHEWFFSEPDQPFVLIGRAGSGKSYTAQRIAKSLKEVSGRLKIALTAPTHRARSVLEKFATQADLTCCISTMQSLLYLKPGKADSKGKRRLEVNEFKWKKADRDPHWSDFGLIIADESSMISDELFSYVDKEKTPVIFMGESYQLPPVDPDSKTEDGKADKLSPVFDLPCGVKLTQVMRYDGEIAKYVDSIANKIEFSEEFLPRISKFETRTGNLIKIASRETWESIMLDIFVSGENCRAIAWTNKRVSELNSLIREAIMGASVAEQPFMVGDRVMAKESIIFEEFNSEWHNWQEGALMQTCDEGEIISIQSTIRNVEHEREVFLANFSQMEIDAIAQAFKLQPTDDINVPVLEITIACDSGEVITTSVVVGYAKAAIERAYSSLKDTAKASDDERKSKAYWRAYFHMQDAFNLIDKTGGSLQRLQFAFASTCHQAQGGTYDYVFSDHSNFMGCKNSFIRDRLVYTASSRAAVQLIAYSKY